MLSFIIYGVKTLDFHTVRVIKKSVHPGHSSVKINPSAPSSVSAAWLLTALSVEEVISFYQTCLFPLVWYLHLGLGCKSFQPAMLLSCVVYNEAANEKKGAMTCLTKWV